MNLGFSFSTAPIQAAAIAPHVEPKSNSLPTSSQLFLNIAAIAAGAGAISSFFSQIKANHYVARMAIPLSPSRDDDTFDQKRAKNLIRKIKTERTEPSNDQRPN